jgi:hypothetical protein
MLINTTTYFFIVFVLKCRLQGELFINLTPQNMNYDFGRSLNVLEKFRMSNILEKQVYLRLTLSH